MDVTAVSKPLSQLSNVKLSDWNKVSSLKKTKIKYSGSFQSSVDPHVSISDNTNWFNNADHSPENRSENDRKRRICQSLYWCPCLLRGIILGSLLAGVVLGTVVTLWLTSDKTVQSSTTQYTSNSLTAATNLGATTVTLTSSAVTASTTTTTATPTCASWLWNTTGETVAGVTNVFGTTSNLLQQPWNIYIDTANNILYIADSLNHRIQKWPIGATNATTIVGSSGGIAGSTATFLNTPKEVFVDSSQNIYVADSLNNRIQFFLNGSTTGVTVSSSWSSPGELWGVQVVNQSIYASSKTGSTIWKNASIIASAQLSMPQGLAVDASINVGTVYVVNSNRHTIVKWPVGASSGSVVAGVDNNMGSTSTLLKYPVSMKLDSYNNMFVVDNNNHRIQLFCRYPTVNTSARTIAGTGVLGQTPQTLNYPSGVALDASLNLYVSDTSNHRIQKFMRLI